MLPGGEDHDQHYTAAHQIRTRPRYECFDDERKILIDDPIWGNCEIGNRPGDEIFLELYTNPLVQRTAAIEQLTLPKHFSTMPGSTEMSRWEHVWGSVVFVRKMVDKAEAQGRVFDDREVLSWQLRTFVSDLGHTAFSHLGDWLFQGYGGKEDQHDEELHDILEIGGVHDILRRHNFLPEEITFPDIHDWIENSSPDLCVDRVDYGAREIARWVTGYEPSTDWLARFQLDEQNRIVLPSKEQAKAFAVNFALLATEHWGHPVHRLQLQLFGELVRSIIADEELRSLFWEDIHHPRDLLYTVDGDVNASSRAVGELNHDLFGVLLDIARAQRKIFAHGRHTELEQAVSAMTTYADSKMMSELKSFPNPLEARHWTTNYTGAKPGTLDFIPVDSVATVEDFDKLPYALDVFLPPLKPRAIDPLYQAGDRILRLSETDEHFKELRNEQARIQSQAYVARLYAAPDFIAKIKEKFQEVESIWQEKLKYKRADQETMRSQFKHIGALAIGTQMAEISWWG